MLTYEVVGAVVEGVLYEPGLSKDVALRRAKAILTIAGIFKTVQPDESDEERRELERLVMNAGKKKKDKEKEKSKGSHIFGSAAKPSPTTPADGEKRTSPA